MVRPTVHSNKHYVQKSLAAVLAGATDNITLARSNTDVDRSVAVEIDEGSTIKAVFIEMWARTQDTAPGTILMSLMKIPGIGALPTFAQMVDLHNYQNKKNILYHTQGLSNDQDADAIPFIRGWFKIPKGKQRFGADDILLLAVSAQALDQTICGFATYKEYS